MTRLFVSTVAACALVALAAAALAQTSATPGPPTQAPPSAPPPAQPTLGDDREAIQAGLKWLALIDGGNSGFAWDEASKQLKSTVTRKQFIAGMRDARKTFGKLESRSAVKFARSHELPGAPSGDYAIIEYEAKFLGGKRMAEQLVWTLEEQDTWRVAGYYYR